MKRIFLGVKLRPQTPPIYKREIGDAAIPFPGNAEYILLPQQTRAISQWTRSLEWRHAVTLQLLPFSYEACSLYLVLLLCWEYTQYKTRVAWCGTTEYPVSLPSICFLEMWFGGIHGSYAGFSSRAVTLWSFHRLKRGI